MTTQSYRYLFGPVPSRRLGISLGVDLVPPKTCTLDCVYCESGSTTRLTVTRKAWVPTEEVKAEIDRYLKENDLPDAITFSGAGEPTLHSGIGEIARFVKERVPEARLVLLTNGTLFGRDDVRRDCLPMDLVIASYDASSRDVFEAVNKPHPSLTPEAMADGLETFQRGFSGEFWLEFFVVPGVNDHDAEVRAIADVASRLTPDRIQVNTLDRPGAESWVTPADKETLEKVTGVLEVGEVISSYGRNRAKSGGSKGLADAIVAMIGRRPATLDDFVASLGTSPDDVARVLDELMSEGRIVKDDQARGCFYKILESPGN